MTKLVFYKLKIEKKKIPICFSLTKARGNFYK